MFPEAPHDPVLRLPAVQALAGVKRSFIYERMAAGRFPRSFPLGPRARGWLKSEVDAWIAARVAERGNAA